jgi:hypothetical protein
MTIKGLSKTAKSGSLIIRDNINARSTASFIVDYNIGESLSVGEQVIIYDDATKIFAGEIDESELSYLQGGTTGKRKRYNVQCIDFNQITDRRKVAASYENQTLSYIINDIVTNVLSIEGVTLGTVDFGSTVISQAVFNYIKVSQAFDYLKSLIPDLNWDINYDKELNFFQRSNNLGVGFTDANTERMTLKETRQQYTNKIFIEAGDSTTETKPDGESKIFGVRFPVSTKPIIKINSVAVSDSDVGILGLDIGKKWYWQKNSRNITQSIVETTLIDTDTISVSYQGLKPIRVTADNPAGQNDRASIEGGSGLYERNEIQKSIDTKAGAKQLADSLLIKYGTIPRNIMIQTKEYRQSGQLVNVNSSNLEILEDTLITDVKIVV